MKKSILFLSLISSTAGAVLAQDSAPVKNQFGVTLSTTIYGFQESLNNAGVGGGLYGHRIISNRVSIYAEINCSDRNFGNLAIKPGFSGELTIRNLAISCGPMFDMGKNGKLSIGLVENYLFRSALKTSVETKDLSAETVNYSSLFFDFRKPVYKELMVGIRYDRGLNSILKNLDKKVSNFSVNLILLIGEKKIRARMSQPLSS
jgi:hypothetical protein